MGDFVARTIAGELQGKPRGMFRYRDSGRMATIGRARAVADVGERFYSGFWAWIVWSIVHIAFLVTFRNRIFVMAGWAWNYIAQVKGARLITGARSPRVKQPYES